MKYSLILITCLIALAGCHQKPLGPVADTWIEPTNYATSVSNATRYVPPATPISQTWAVRIESPITPITIKVYNNQTKSLDTYTTPYVAYVPAKTTLMVIPVIPSGYVFDSWSLTGNAYSQNTVMTWTAPRNANTTSAPMQTLDIIVAPSSGG